MSSVTFTLSETESAVIILKPFALIFATSGLRSGTEKPMWFTVVPIRAVGRGLHRAEKDQNIGELDNLLLPVTGTDPDYDAAKRVGVELLLGIHVRGVQMVVPVHDWAFSDNQDLRMGKRRQKQQGG